MQRGTRLVGTGQVPLHKYWHEELQMIQKGDLDPLQMVSHRVRLEDLDKVYCQVRCQGRWCAEGVCQTQFSSP